MIMKVLAYKDTKLNVFAQPFFVKNASNEDLIEDIRRMCAGDKVPARFFEYDLYLLGEYEDKTGELKASAPEFLVSIADFKYLKEKEKEENA